MKLVSLIALTTLMAASAQAEVVTCAFTEPFLTMKYDPSQKTVSVHEGIENVTNTYKVKDVDYDPSGTMTVRWGSEEELSSLSFQEDVLGGSDGMSELFFPMTGEYRVGDTHSLIGGCETPSTPALDPSKSPVPGCYEVLRAEFEDGASYYKAISEKIIQPLRAIPSATALADFLQSMLINRGNMDVNLELCRTLDEVVK